MDRGHCERFGHAWDPVSWAMGSGFVVHENWVLTAAHLVRNLTDMKNEAPMGQIRVSCSAKFCLLKSPLPMVQWQLTNWQLANSDFN